MLASALSSPYDGVRPAQVTLWSWSPTASMEQYFSQGLQGVFNCFSGRERDLPAHFWVGSNQQLLKLMVFCSGIWWNRLFLHSTVWPCHQQGNVHFCLYPGSKQPRSDPLPAKDTSQIGLVTSWAPAEQIPTLNVVRWTARPWRIMLIPSFGDLERTLSILFLLLNNLWVTQGHLK